VQYIWKIFQGKVKTGSNSILFKRTDEVVQMESENQELVVESFPFKQADLRNDNSNEERRTRRPPVWMKDYCS
jgi:hypothetical protein